MIHAYKDIKYNLIKTNRKTMSIYVERDGSITVRTPKTITMKQLDSIIELKRYWIYKSISEIEELNRTKVERQIVDGEGFLYMGRSHRLKIGNNLEKPLSLSQGYFLLDSNHIHKAREHFIKFYKERGKKHIGERVDYFKKKLGVNPENIRIMDLKNRWASRSKKGLNFHWKIMLAPITIIDYIIFHELVHFIKPNHSAEFWEIVESVIPNYQERKNWLRINGANLDI